MKINSQSNRPKILRIIFLPLALMILAGMSHSCYLPDILHNKAEPSDSALVVPIAIDEIPVDTAAAESERDFSQSDLKSQLDSVSVLLEQANDFQASEQLVQAGYYYANAKFLFSLIDADEVEEYEQFYKLLLREINHFYDEYIAEMDTLPEETPPETIIEGVEEAFDDSVEVSTEHEVEFSQEEIRQAVASTQILPDIPLVMNSRVGNAIRFFQGKGRKSFENWMERGKYHIPLIKAVLVQEGMPEDLVYLAMIESGFKPTAYSYAHAAGPWQFIKSTGELFDLEINYWYDERCDPIKATIAATKYLKKLYNDFDDWYLSFAAYNCGEGRVARHIRTYNTKDFWQLNRLPRQTRNYVPTYIAATIIARDPVKYGFADWDFSSEYKIDSVLVTECIDLKDIAKACGCSVILLKDYNTAIMRSCTPPDEKIWFYLPYGKGEVLTAKLNDLPVKEKQDLVKYKVKRGDNLSKIAARYGTTVSAIMSIKENNIKSRRSIIRVGQILSIPSAGMPTQPSVTQTSKPSQPRREKITHTVVRGDNLSKIAKLYSTSVSSIKKWNNIYKSNQIYPGQKLTIYALPLNTSDKSYINYTVKKNDTIWDIANLYNVSVTDIKRLNKITDHRSIKPGDKIKIALTRDNLSKTETKEEVVYIVKKGDSLWKIAKKFGITISDIKKANNLKSAKIQPGDKLKIPAS